jgi:hypothetical protein
MMKKSLFFVASAIAIVLLSVPGTAKAPVAFGGTVRGPHGSFSIGVGGPFVPVVGAYVPQPFIEQVYLSPDYGYGFEYDSRWVPCRRYGSRWIISGSPFVYGRPIVRNYGYRNYGQRYVQPYRSYGRGFARRDFDDRRSRSDRDGRQSRGHRGDRRW